MIEYPIHITTKSIQKRKHHKRRINKKWFKRYGTIDYDLLPNDDIQLIDGIVYMNKKTFDKLFNPKIAFSMRFCK